MITIEQMAAELKAIAADNPDARLFAAHVQDRADNGGEEGRPRMWGDLAADIDHLLRKLA